MEINNLINDNRIVDEKNQQKPSGFCWGLLFIGWIQLLQKVDGLDDQFFENL